MNDRPLVPPGEWVYVGSGLRGKSSVVCEVYADQTMGDLEVVYLDDRDRAINEDVVWDGKRWQFKYTGAVGGYADKASRLGRYVSLLRSGGRPVP